MKVENSLIYLPKRDELKLGIFHYSFTVHNRNRQLRARSFVPLYCQTSFLSAVGMERQNVNLEFEKRRTRLLLLVCLKMEVLDSLLICMMWCNIKESGATCGLPGFSSCKRKACWSPHRRWKLRKIWLRNEKTRPAPPSWVTPISTCKNVVSPTFGLKVYKNARKCLNCCW